MKTAILVDDANQTVRVYRDFMVRVCEAAGIEFTELPWTGNVEQDMEQLRAADPDQLFVQGHHTHHGFRLARLALEELGIQPLIMSSVSEPFPIWLPIQRVNQDDFEYAVQLLKHGSITCGATARLVMENVGAIDSQLESARAFLRAAEQAASDAHGAARRYVTLCGEIQKNQKARATVQKK